MATETAPPVAPAAAPPWSGLKYFDRLTPLLKPLHEVGCDRDRAGNRILHDDDYCQRVLLSMDLCKYYLPFFNSACGV